jgi:prephenate dehydrogenase/chorismate mutase
LKSKKKAGASFTLVKARKSKKQSYKVNRVAKGVGLRKSKNFEKNLAEQRKQMQVLAFRIVNLLAKRQELSRAIAESKLKLGLEVEDAEAEKKLFDLGLDHANKVGLGTNTAKELLNFLVSESKFLQNEIVGARRVRNNLASLGIKVVAVIGAGKMGTWFGEYFAKFGRSIIFLDSHLDKSTLAAQRVNGRATTNIEELFLANPDLIILATPVSSMERLILQVDEIAKRRSSVSRKGKQKMILLEIGSVKLPVLRILRLCTNVLPISLHPMFGGQSQDNLASLPSSPQSPFEPKKCVLVKVNDFENESTISDELFPNWEMLTMNAEDHDWCMSFILSLVHLLNLAFALTVAGADLTMLKSVSGPSFARQASIAEDITKENPSTYADIQISNSFTNQTLKLFLNHFNEIFSTIQSGDNKSLSKLFDLMRIEKLL